MIRFCAHRCNLSMLFRLTILFIVFYSNRSRGQAQSAQIPDSTVIIRSITITGNLATKPGIISRELDFKEHDTVSCARFAERLISSRQNIFNTRLFNFVTIDTAYSVDHLIVDVYVAVVERWYIWPVPYLEISDRNFNVWWETRDFNRLTYGVDLTFFNVRGRNETLKILAHFGFNQNFGFTYKIPYVNARQTAGIGFGASVMLNRELAVSTLNNEPVYVRNDSAYLKKLIYAFGECILRPDFFTIHTLRIAWSHYDFDSAIRVTPGFSMVEEDVQQFASFTYLLKIDHRDVQYYPLTGYCIDAEVNHAVPYMTAHNSYLKSNLRIYRQIGSRWYCASGFTGKLSFEKAQPYYLQKGFGYGRDYVRGYEYYVIDGQHFALLKNNLKFALVPRQVTKLGFIHTTKFNTIPLALYLNAFIDLGYVYRYPANDHGRITSGNKLENSFLMGYGLGVDFTTYYDIVIRLEGSMNRLNQPGVYLHFIAAI
ncbi:MAG: hypothetical protein ACOYNC_06485 [Bacteroidales bacterium]